MKKSARISGTVTYLNEEGQRRGIPHGPCEIEEYDSPNEVAASIWWSDEQGNHRTDLTEKEWAHYKSTKAFVIEG